MNRPDPQAMAAAQQKRFQNRMTEITTKVMNAIKENEELSTTKIEEDGRQVDLEAYIATHVCSSEADAFYGGIPEIKLGDIQFFMTENDSVVKQVTLDRYEQFTKPLQSYTYKLCLQMLDYLQSEPDNVIYNAMKLNSLQKHMSITAAHIRNLPEKLETLSKQIESNTLRNILQTDSNILQGLRIKISMHWKNNILLKEGEHIVKKQEYLSQYASHIQQSFKDVKAYGVLVRKSIE